MIKLPCQSSLGLLKRKAKTIKNAAKAVNTKYFRRSDTSSFDLSVSCSICLSLYLFICHLLFIKYNQKTNVKNKKRQRIRVWRRLFEGRR